jgi:hypothetical protein
MLHLMTVVYGRKRQKVKGKSFICAVGNYENQIDPQGKTERERSWWPPRGAVYYIFMVSRAPRTPGEGARRGPPSPHLTPSPTLYYWSTGSLQSITWWGPYCPRRAQPQRDVAGIKELSPSSDKKAVGRPGPHSLTPPLKGVGGSPFAGPHIAGETTEAADGTLPRVTLSLYTQGILHGSGGPPNPKSGWSS